MVSLRVSKLSSIIVVVVLIIIVVIIVVPFAVARFVDIEKHRASNTRDNRNPEIQSRRHYPRPRTSKNFSKETPVKIDFSRNNENIERSMGNGKSSLDSLKIPSSDSTMTKSSNVSTSFDNGTRVFDRASILDSPSTEEIRSIGSTASKGPTIRANFKTLTHHFPTEISNVSSSVQESNDDSPTPPRISILSSTTRRSTVNRGEAWKILSPLQGLDDVVSSFEKTLCHNSNESLYTRKGFDDKILITAELEAGPKIRSLLDIDGPSVSSDPEALEDQSPSDIAHKRAKRDRPSEFQRDPSISGSNYLQDLEDSFAPSALEMQRGLDFREKIAQSGKQLGTDANFRRAKRRLERDAIEAEIDDSVGDSKITREQDFRRDERATDRRDVSTVVRAFSIGNPKRSCGIDASNARTAIAEGGVDSELENGTTAVMNGPRYSYTDRVEAFGPRTRLVRSKRFADGFVHRESSGLAYSNEQFRTSSNPDESPEAADNRVIDSILSKVDYGTVNGRVEEEPRERSDDEVGERTGMIIRGGRGARFGSRRRVKRKKGERRKEAKKMMKNGKRSKRFFRDSADYRDGDGRDYETYYDYSNFEARESPVAVRTELREDVGTSFGDDGDKEHSRGEVGTIDGTRAREKRENAARELEYYENIRESNDRPNATTEIIDKKHVAKAARSVRVIKKLVQELLLKVNELYGYGNETIVDREPTKDTRSLSTVFLDVGPTPRSTATTTNPIRAKSIVEKTTSKPVNASRRRESCWKSATSERRSRASRNGRPVKMVGSAYGRRVRRERKSRRKWDRWTDWSSCSVTCGRGRQIRWRHCTKSCSAAETEMEEKACQLPACAPGKFLGIFG